MNIQKIAVLIGSFDDGGAERVMVNIANGIAARGVQVDLLMGDPSGNYRHEISDQVNLIDLKEKNISKGIFKIIKYIRTQKPQILLSTQKHINIAAILAGKLSLSKTKIVIRESNTPSVAQKNAPSRKGHFVWNLTKFIYPMTDAVVSVSKGMTKDILSFYKFLPKYKLKTIYSPIVTKEMMASAKEKVEHPFFDSGEPVIIALGKISKQKDFPTMIKAFAKVRAKRPGKLLILGNTTYDKSLFEFLNKLVKEEGIEEHVDFAGFKKNPFPYVNQSKVYVMSSLFEGLPGALIQGMALGCNMVSTDCPHGPAEILEGGKNGSLVPVGDVEQLAAAMEAALEKPLDRQQGFENSKPFHFETAVDNFLKCFEELVT